MVDQRQAYRNLCIARYEGDGYWIRHVINVGWFSRVLAKLGGADPDTVIDAAYGHELSGMRSARVIGKTETEAPELSYLLTRNTDEMASAELSAAYSLALMRRVGYPSDSMGKVCRTITHAGRLEQYPPETMEAKCLQDADSLDFTGKRGVERLVYICLNREIDGEVFTRLLDGVVRNPKMLTTTGIKVAKSRKKFVKETVPEHPEKARLFFYEPSIEWRQRAERLKTSK